MDSSEETSGSSFTGMDTSVSEYDTIAHIELPFGDKISAMDETLRYQQDSGNQPIAQVRGVSLMRELEGSRPHTDVEDDEEEDVEMYDTPGSEDEPISVDESDDLEPLAYARQHGLTANYFDEDPLRAFRIPSPPNSLLADIDDPHDPYTRDVHAAKTLTEQFNNERWDVDKEIAEFLTSVMALSRNDEPDDALATTSLKDLKIDEPLLSSDPETDLARLRARDAARISTKGMNSCPVDVEKGESLSWSSEHFKLPSAVSELIATEKLDVDKETMEMLREVLQPSALDQWEAVEQAIEADKPRKLRRESTPLLPLSPPLSPCHVNNGAYDIEMTSSPDNLFAQEAAEVEAELFEDDDPSHQLATSSRTFGGENTSDDIRDLTRTPITSSSSPLRRKRLRDLRAETPLLHQGPESSPSKRTKKVSFPAELHTLIPAPDTDDSIMDPDRAHQDIDHFIKDVVTPIAQSVIDEVNNEKLDELDTILRVKVPIVEAVEPSAPWMAQSGQNHAALLAQTQKEMPNGQKKWSGLSKLEQVLSWTPFPRYLGKISMDEQFDDGSCERYLAGLSLEDDSIDVDALLWKPEGIRLLDSHDSDDDELEAADLEDDDEQALMEGPIADKSSTAVRGPAVLASQEETQKPQKPVTGRMDMQALLQRRKLELEAGNKPKEADSPDAAHAAHRPDSTAAKGKAADVSSWNLTNGGLRGFLGLQGAKTLETGSTKSWIQEQPPLAPPPATVAQAPAIPELPELPAVLPAPSILDPMRAMSVVILSTTLANRQLVREIQAQLPALELIERYSTSLASNADEPSNACEADFTLSPCTGLICTTLQKLKQRPLPGQTSYFGVRERVAAVSPRYESISLFVSEGKQDDLLPTRALDDRDTAAVNDLIGFVTSLDCNIEVCYVPGGEKEMAIWIASSISRHSCDVEGAKLLHDETIWERLLRSAGANPAAAQSILAKLKRPESVEASESSSSYCGSDGLTYGLPAFVRMSVDERVQRFGPLMGGDRVLARASGIIDGGWMSASRQ